MFELQVSIGTYSEHISKYRSYYKLGIQADLNSQRLQVSAPWMENGKLTY